MRQSIRMGLGSLPTRRFAPAPPVDPPGVNLQLRHVSATYGGGNMFGNDRSVFSGGVLFFTNGLSLYSFDVTNPAAPTLIGSLLITPSGGGGGGGDYPATVTMSDTGDANADGVYTFIEKTTVGTCYGASDFTFAVYSNPHGYWMIISPVDWGNRVDIFDNTGAGWDSGTKTFDSGTGGFIVNFNPDPSVQDWRSYADTGTLLDPQPTGVPAGTGGGGELTGDVPIASMIPNPTGEFMFVIMSDGKVATVAIDDPSSMTIQAIFNMGLTSYSGSGWSEIKSGHIFTQAGYDGGGAAGYIVAINFANPLALALAATARHPDNSPGGGGVAIIGNRLFVCDYFSLELGPGVARIHELNITTPASMAITATYDATYNEIGAGHPALWTPWGMSKIGNTLLVFDDFVIQPWDCTTPGAAVKKTATEDNQGMDTEGFCVVESLNVCFNSISGVSHGGPGGTVGIRIVNLATPFVPTYGTLLAAPTSTSHLGTAEESLRLFGGCVGGMLAIWSY